MNNDYMERAHKAIDEKTLYPYTIAMTIFDDLELIYDEED